VVFAQQQLQHKQQGMALMPGSAAKEPSAPKQKRYAIQHNTGLHNLLCCSMQQLSCKVRSGITTVCRRLSHGGALWMHFRGSGSVNEQHVSFNPFTVGLACHACVLLLLLLLAGVSTVEATAEGRRS
jgi:hypothetical protein